jgi:hypothetical protein
MPVEPTSLILVTVINNPRDLEIARVLGWYRIPLKTAPKVVAVDYLAFYQTSAFGDEKWRISYTAQVCGYELTTRKELLRDEPDHPNAQHEYFKLQLGTLERLTSPIPAHKWRRITFFYTTGEYLLRAKSIDDLVVQSSERQILWRALRERAEQNGDHSFSAIPEYSSYELEIDPGLLAGLLGIREADQTYL